VVPTGELLDDCDPAILTAFRSTLSTLDKVEERRLPALDTAQSLMDRHGTLAVAEAHQHLGHFVDDPRDVDPLILRRLRTFNPAGEPVLRAAQPRLRAQLRDELDGAILLCPPVRDPAPPVAPLLANLDTMTAVNSRTLRSTMLLSYFGLPGVALPHGTLPGNLRGSILLSTPAGHDDRLLAAAAILEER
jgi:aspartyl-tRNA(Asn)/glutamyl-tRNA(Gln) amidotransferase subunit A